jgi:hypothetical protein
MLSTRLYCPHPDCVAQVTRTHIERVATRPDDTDFVHPLLTFHDELALNSFLGGNNQPSIRWCPGPDCSQIILPCGENVFVPPPNRRQEAGYGTFAYCSTCETRFCFHCGTSREQHDRETMACPPVLPFEGQQVTMAVDEEENNNDADFVAAIADVAAGLPNSVPNVQWPQETTTTALTPTGKIRRCPKCAVHIEKTGGCNHMQ